MFVRNLFLSVPVFCFLLFSTESQAKIISCYGGFGVTASKLDSEFHMDYSHNQRFFMSYPNLQHENNKIRRVGGVVFVGIRANLDPKLFLATEINFNSSKARHYQDFFSSDYCEVSDPCVLPGRTAYIDIKHGNELSWLVKIGGTLNDYNIYSIAGVTTKNISLKYGIDEAHFHNLKSLEFNLKKRIYGPVLGLGISKPITEKIICSMEYKYKLYKTKKNLDWTNDTRRVFSSAGYLHDMSERHFKLNSNKHEIAIRAAINM